MQHSRKHIDQYLAANPDTQKWINQCPLCGVRGRKPEMPDEIGSVHGRLVAHTLKQMLPVLEADQNEFCLTCSRLYHQKR